MSVGAGEITKLKELMEYIPQLSEIDDDLDDISSFLDGQVERAKELAESERAHVERMRHQELLYAAQMKALETGQPTPEVQLAHANATRARAQARLVDARSESSWAEAEVARVRAAGRVGYLVPVVLALVAAGCTGLLVFQTDASLHLMLLCLVWGVCGLVSVAAVVTCWRGLQPHERPAPSEPTDEEEEFDEEVNVEGEEDEEPGEAHQELELVRDGSRLQQTPNAGH
jgi:hypothetical protein